MKKVILGTFSTLADAEKLIQHVHSDLGVRTEDISYIYRNKEGELTEGSGTVSGGTAGEGASAGAVVGGSVGALAGIATVIGVIPVIGPIFAAGPLLAALGIGAGAAATVAAGALTGAMAGGLIGALVNLGAPESEAREYEERIKSGDVLVVVHAEDDAAIKGAFASHDASAIHTYSVT